MTLRFTQCLLLIVALTASGCRNVEETRSAADATPATELSTSTDTTVTTTGSTGGTVSALSPSDKEFVMTVAQSNFAEVQLGLLAGQKSANADVRAFAARMVQDHGKTMETMRKLVTDKGLVLPSEPANESVTAARDLAGKSRADFDRPFMAQMVADHEKAVAKFDEASRTAADADVKSFAATTLPTLQEHLRMAKEIQTKLK
jgi:putative membrane protein